MNDEDLPIPEALPEIPRGKFWGSVLAPPFLFFVFLPFPGMGALPLTLVAIIICGAIFVECMMVRFRGRSLVLLWAGYVVGEIVGCLAIVAYPFLISYLFG